jgi:signal transduction histidine kinase/CheY-like chemotaxis protein
MRVDDLIIAIVFFTIPLQILFALFKYPRLSAMPWTLCILSVQFALFILLCGIGHLYRGLGLTHDTTFNVLNAAAAFISLTTALNLLPLIPRLFDSLDRTLAAETESKRKLMTFMSFLCHEIRTPLFAITSSITFLGDDRESLSKDQRSSLDCIENSANLMLRLVNDVLDISKLESGKLQLDNHAFNLVQLMEGAAASMRKEIDQKRKGAVQFDFQIGDQVPQEVVADSARLLQIAYNLLSNATKFTEDGFVRYSMDIVPIRKAVENNWITSAVVLSDETGNAESIGGTADLSLGLLEAAAEEGRATDGNVGQQIFRTTYALKLEVEDSGVGIASEHLHRIFEPYEQSKLSDYRKHGGTGLGLSILNSLTEIMGGSIHVQSQLGEGSTFTVYVPVTVSENPKIHLEKGVRGKDKGGIDLANQRMKNIFTDSMVATEPGTTSFLNSSPPPLNSSPLPLERDSKTKTLTTSTTNITTKTTTTCSVELTSSSSLTSPRTSVRRKNSSTLQLQQLGIPAHEKIILVVDDNAINRKLLGRMLSHFEIQYEEAINGQEAVDFMKRSRNFTRDPEASYVGLVLMDWCMPVMDGCEAIQVIRELGMLVPIVAVTACALEEGLQELIKSGANEISTKPILRDDLFQICQKYLL